MGTDRVRLAKAHHPVTVLGYGRRVGVWLQGCHLGCPGCLSRDTWASDDTSAVPLDELVAWVVERLPDTDGLTISGGEPSEQLHAVAELSAAVHAANSPSSASRDVLVYSGLAWDDLRRLAGESLADVDAVVSEPFVATLAADDGWRGSTNQVHRPLTALGRERTPSTWAPARRLQVEVDETGVWFVGIPRHGDLARLQADLREQGVVLGEVSWRP